MSEVTETELAAKAVAPRVTLQDVKAAIRHAFIFTADVPFKGGTSRVQKELPALSLLTICVLVLQNGFLVTGESACASPENFDAEIGRQIAEKNAEAKVWQLLGYALKDRLHAASEAQAEAEFRAMVG